MRDKFKKVLNQVISEYESNENILGLLLFGSLAKGTEHSRSDIDLIAISEETEDKTTNKLYGDIAVQTIWRSKEDFRVKTSKRTRFTPASKSYKVLIDKESWIREFLKSDIVQNTWKEPLPLTEREKLLMSTDFASSLDAIKGFDEQGKHIEIEMFINDYIYLGLELLYNNRKWFIKPKKYILEDLKVKSPEVWGLVREIYYSKSVDNRLDNFEKFYFRIIKSIDHVRREYTIYW